MHNRLDYNQSISVISKFETTDTPSSLLVVGGSSGYGRALKDHFLSREWIVNSAGLSSRNDYQIDLQSEHCVNELALKVMNGKYEYLVITAATAFLGDQWESQGYDRTYISKMHLNAFCLWTLCRQLSKLDYMPNAIILFTSEAAWSQSPKSHLHYNLSKSILNTLIINMYECYNLVCIGVDPGEARTRMNRNSQRSPSTIIPIIEWIFAMSKKRPEDLAGKFFHSDGRCLSYSKSAPFINHE